MVSKKNSLLLGVLLITLSAFFFCSVLFAAELGPDKKKSKNDEAWLGIYMQDVNDDIAEAFGFEFDDGILINGVFDNSPAEDAGLKSGDVIIKIDDRRVDDVDDLSRAIDRFSPGDKITITVFRENEEETFSAMLSEKDKYADKTFSSIKKFSKNNVKIKSYGFLGVYLESLEDQLAEYFEVEDGALIKSIVEDSPAESVGLKAGDVIVAIAGKDVDDSDDVTKILRKHDPGDEVVVEVVRRGSMKSFNVVLDEKEEIFSDFYAPEVIWSGDIWDNLNFDYDFDFDFDKDGGFYLGLEGIDEFKEELGEELEELREELMELKEELQELREK